MFKVSRARREVLRKLADRAWSPTDLARELGKSPETVYNHLNALAEQGVLTKTQEPAKTRPKTVYSIGRGLVQYIAVLPGQFHEGSLELTDTKDVMFRIWTIPQDEFHPYVERYWWSVVLHGDIDLNEDVTAAGVYGSVARGDAEEDSDIDILIVAHDEDAKARLAAAMGSVVLHLDGRSRLGMTEVYTEDEFRDSRAHGSDFLAAVMDEIHPLFDPTRILKTPMPALVNE